MREGRLKLLGVTSPDRWFSVPDAATVAEGPLPGFTMLIWWGLQAPTGTPPPVLERFENAMLAAFSEAETRDRLRGIGVEAAPLGTAAFGRLVAAEHAKWGEVVRNAGVRTD